MQITTSRETCRKPISSVSLSSNRSRILRCESRTLCVLEVTVFIVRRNRRSQIRIVRYRKALRIVAGVSLGVVRVTDIHECLGIVLGCLADITNTLMASWEVLCVIFSIDDPLFAGEGRAVYTVHRREASGSRRNSR
jgi:hypothetical protein